MNGLFFAINELQIAVAPEIAAAEAQGIGTAGPWRPPEWSGPALTMITVPAPVAPGTQGLSLTDALGTNALPGAPSFQPQPTFLVFDAILRAEHARVLRRTEHPIQTSPNTPVTAITDHAYMLPARVTLEIGMSDAMDSFSSAMWTSNASKSISAFETLVSLQQARTLVTLTTRLATYSNMLVEEIAPTDTFKTRNGLRATVVLSEIFLAQISTSQASGVSSSSNGTPSGVGWVGGFLIMDGVKEVAPARPQTTVSTPTGSVLPTPVNSAITQQFNVTKATVPFTSIVPGAGNWCSNNTSGLSGLLG